MAYAHLNPFDAVGDGASTAPQTFQGVCSQARVDIPTVPAAFSATPDMVVDPITSFVQVVSDGKLKIYAGPAAATSTEKQAKAFVMASGTYAFDVDKADAIHVWAA